MTAALNPIARAAQKLAGVRPVSAGDSAPQLPHSSSGAAQASAQAQADLPVDVLAAQLKKTLARKILLSSGASLIPLPLIDLAVDAIVLVNILNEVHTALGLSPAQIAALDAGKRQRTYAAIQFVGNKAIGKMITQAVVVSLVKGVGIKLTGQQLAKAVPIAGQIASAALNYATLKHLVHAHIDDCVQVLKQSNVV